MSDLIAPRDVRPKAVCWLHWPGGASDFLDQQSVWRPLRAMCRQHEHRPADNGRIRTPPARSAGCEQAWAPRPLAICFRQSILALSK
jgi:hypothetical protein